MWAGLAGNRHSESGAPAWRCSLAGTNVSKQEAEAFAALQALGLLSIVGSLLQHVKFKMWRASGQQACCCCWPATPGSATDLQWAFGKLDHLWHLCVADLGSMTCDGPGRLAGRCWAVWSPSSALARYRAPFWSMRLQSWLSASAGGAPGELESRGAL